MTDITTEQLNDLMSPLWEREPELRPTRIYWNTHVDAATQLCESSMVRWLMRQHKAGAVHIDFDAGVVQVWVYAGKDAVMADGPTLVVALAAACTAVLDANEKRGAS